MSDAWRGASSLLLVSAVLCVGAVLLIWGLGGQEIAGYWQSVGLLLGSFWGGWLYTVICNRKAEWLFVPLASALISLGWLEVSRVCVGYHEPEAVLRYAQFAAVGMGVFIFFSLLLRDYRMLEDYKYVVLLVGVVFQLSLFIFGTGINGAKLWISVGGFQLQPIEFVKILIVVFLAAYLRQFRNWIRLGLISKAGRLPRKALMLLGIGMAISEGVLVGQRDLGMALLLFGIFVSLFYVATGRVDLVALAAVLSAGGAYFCYKFFDHVQTRVDMWLNPFSEPHGRGFQMCQSLFSLANGGADGTGLGLGCPYLIPDSDTDFIFSALGEELGLCGLAALILLLILLFSRCFIVALRANDEFGTLLACGLASLWAWQSLIVMWGCTKMMPMTGITLPFVSRGGSSMVANFIIMAILWRISWPEEDNSDGR